MEKGKVEDAEDIVGWLKLSEKVSD